MTPKTKQDVDREIERLRKLRHELPDAVRPVTQGWMFVPSMLYDTAPSKEHSKLQRINREVPTTLYLIATIDGSGIELQPRCESALDGIAHDSKGRIKVVGYVPVDLLKERIEAVRPHREALHGMLWDIIDELAG